MRDPHPPPRTEDTARREFLRVFVCILHGFFGVELFEKQLSRCDGMVQLEEWLNSVLKWKISGVAAGEDLAILSRSH